ncbi:MAG: dihydrofolate synthase [Coriobacteriia bacterium]|nr:dihydrofolate synthase [Coriobacteriia bacterium]MBN2841294.1 dihydrofolate synthase [Coriobacteriia bacterium]
MSGDEASYVSALERLSRALTFGINPSLDGIRELTGALGCPERECSCVQVTGTNGKTSVTRMVGAILTAHGYRTGVYTSPHLVSYTERITIDGEPLSERAFAAVLGDVFEAADSLDREFTEFELLTAAALHAFRLNEVEFACLEVGMGGRWDATSVVDPVVAVITGVALDHTDRLGTTREEIAADKAHIIKARCFPILGPGCEGVEHIFEERVRSLGLSVIARVGLRECDDITWRIVRCPRTPGGTLTVDIAGMRDYRVTIHAPAYQAANVALAMAAAGAAIFNVLDPAAVDTALRTMTFPGRFELLRREPPLVLDGAHNPDAAAVLSSAIRDSFRGGLPVIVLGVLADKDVEGIVRALADTASGFIATENGSSRCLPADELAAVVERVTGRTTLAVPVLREALAIARERGGEGGVVVTGSLHTVGAVKALGHDIP